MKSIDQNLKNNRVINTLRNQISGMIFMIAVTVIPFILRSVMLHTIGEFFLGLNSLFISLLGVISLSDLGIGAVLIYFLYEPLAHNDMKKLNAYLYYIKTLYHYVALIAMVIGVCLMPFLKYMIANEIPGNCNIYVVYMIYLSTYVVGCFMWPEQIILSGALQRYDIENWINLIGNLCGYILQFIALLVFKSYGLYVGSLIFQTAAIITLRYGAKKKCFNSYVPYGSITHEEKNLIKTKMKRMIGHQIDEKMIGTVDTIFISIFMGLTVVAAYTNYFLIVTAMGLLFFNIIKAALPSIGNAVIVETKESNYFRYRCIFFMSSCLVGFGTASMFCLYSTFMDIWLGHNEYGLDMILLFCTYFYINGMRQSTLLFKNATGMWDNDRYKPYVAIFCNIILDILLIQMIGVKGAIISSIISIGVIELPWETRVLYRDYFNKSLSQYMKVFIKYLMGNIVIIWGSYYTCNLVSLENIFGEFFIKITICVAWTMLVYVMFYLKNKDFHKFISIVWKYIKKCNT